ncbi:hypothetical protein K1719_043450 [Acacia pycnantha]|nr:hypothetical protein K1719_043450 [Acacia pycnantha]
MLHPVPFDDNLKDDPPPHPGEDQSAKRAKINEGPMQDDSMEAVQSSDLDPLMNQASANPSLECVLETQMSSDSQQLQDCPMEEDSTAAVPKAPSFKDKLLNGNSDSRIDDEEDIVLNQDDVSIGSDGKIPTINFASHVINILNKRMDLTVVVKLLGKKIGYRYLLSKLQSLWKPSGQLKLIYLNDDCFLVRFQEDLDY